MAVRRSQIRLPILACQRQLLKHWKHRYLPVVQVRKQTKLPATISFAIPFFCDPLCSGIFASNHDTPSGAPSTSLQGFRRGFHWKWNSSLYLSQRWSWVRSSAPSWSGRGSPLPGCQGWKMFEIYRGYTSVTPDEFLENHGLYPEKHDLQQCLDICWHLQYICKMSSLSLGSKHRALLAASWSTIGLG